MAPARETISKVKDLQPINHRYTRDTAANAPQDLAYHIEDSGAAQNQGPERALAREAVLTEPASRAILWPPERAPVRRV